MSLADIQDRTFASALPATAGSYPPESRLSALELEAYLDSRAFAVASTARPDGRPHAAMTSFVRRDARFFLPTTTGSVRERNLRAQPWMVLTITEGDHDEHVVVIAEGPASVVEPGQVPADVRDEMSGDWVTCWLCLDAQRVLSYGAPAARSKLVTMHTFLPEEWELMREIRLRALRDSPDAFGSTLERELAMDEEAWRGRCASGRNFYAAVGRTPVGIIASYIPEDSPDAPELVGMWVAPEHRRRGIARALIDAVLDQARSEGARAVTLWVADGNGAAEELYAGVGFSRTGREDTLPGRPEILELEMSISL